MTWPWLLVLVIRPRIHVKSPESTAISALLSVASACDHLPLLLLILTWPFRTCASQFMGQLIANPMSVSKHLGGCCSCLLFASWEGSRSLQGTGGHTFSQEDMLLVTAGAGLRLSRGPPEITPWDRRRNSKAPHYDPPQRGEQTTPSLKVCFFSIHRSAPCHRGAPHPESWPKEGSVTLLSLGGWELSQRGRAKPASASVANDTSTAGQRGRYFRLDSLWVVSLCFPFITYDSHKQILKQRGFCQSTGHVLL